MSVEKDLIKTDISLCLYLPIVVSNKMVSVTLQTKAGYHEELVYDSCFLTTFKRKNYTCIILGFGLTVQVVVPVHQYEE
jgi:hypothetical protein